MVRGIRSLLLLSITVIRLYGQTADTTPLPAKDLFALQWHTGEHWPTDKSPREALASIAGAKIEESAKLAGFGIVLVGVQPPSLPEALGESIAAFLKSTKEWLPVPVLHSNGLDQVPTPELIVRFKPAITKAHAEMFLVEHRLRIIEPPSSLAPKRYLVRADGVPASRIYELKSELDHEPEIRYVDVNFVVVRQFDSQKRRP